MPRRREVFVPGAYYHVFNRGVDRQRIFFERDNSLYFLQKVREFLLAPVGSASDVRSDPDAPSVRVTDSTAGVSVLAYCLMSNHFHLLVRLNCHDFVAGLAAAPVEWEFSSYPEYIGQRGGTLPNISPIIQLAGSVDAYRQFVEYESVAPRPDLQHLWMDDRNR